MIPRLAALCWSWHSHEDMFGNTKAFFTSDTISGGYSEHGVEFT